MKRPVVSFARMPRVVFTCGIAALLGSLAVSTHAVTIDMVPVGNPGNANDPATGGIYGAVAYDYQIGKYDVTIGQYTDFLNAVAKTDTYSLYSASMATTLNIAGISRTGSSGSYTYSVIAPSGTTPTGASSPGNRPITYVSWYDAARFANWLANGQPAGAQTSTTTENGAYNVNGATSGNAVAKNVTNPNTGTAPTFYIPTESEWYKAAYYSPVLNSGSGGYYTYATQSNTVQTAVQATTTGVGRIGAAGTTPVTSGNFANFNLVADWNSQNGNVTTVGTNGGPSYYGAFDMGGNVVEWNDLTGAADLFRQRRGGNWSLNAARLPSSQFDTSGTDTETNTTGFRLVAVPEPSTWVMGLAGIACVAWRSVRRRRAR